jgi:hypothetical protein
MNLVNLALDWLENRNGLRLDCYLEVNQGSITLAKVRSSSKLQLRLKFDPQLTQPPEIAPLGMTLGDMQTRGGSFNLGPFTGTGERSRGTFEVVRSTIDNNVYDVIDIDLASIRIPPDSQQIILAISIELPQTCLRTYFQAQVEAFIVQGQEVSPTFRPVVFENKLEASVEANEQIRHYLDDLGKEIHARCIELWRGIGLSEEEARYFADNKTIGKPSQEYFPRDEMPLVILTAPVGSGKSLTAMRIVQETIETRKANNLSSVPVFFIAKEISGSLQQEIEGRVSNWGGLYNESLLVVIDGLDEVDSSKAEDLLKEARILTRIRENTRVVITSRMVGILSRSASAGEILTIPELTEERVLNLVNHLSGREYFRIWWEDPIREAVKRPLFAIMFGQYLRQRDVNPDLSLGELINQFVDEALKRYDLSGLEEILQNLAVTSVDRGGGLIPTTTIQSEKVKKLVDSGLITQRPNGVDFPLVFVRDWFAAKSVTREVEPFNQMTSNPQRLYRWKQPLTLAVGISSPEALSRFLPNLIEHYPGFASQIIQKGTSRDTGHHKEISSCPPPWECDASVKNATQVWLQGLGPLRLMLEPREILSGVFGNRLSVTFQFPDGSGSSHNRYPGTQPAWEWRLTLTALGNRLGTFLEDQDLPIPDTVMASEKRWEILTSLLRNRVFSQTPITIADVEQKLASLDTQIGSHLGIIWSAEGRRFSLDKTEIPLIEGWLGGLKQQGQIEIYPPWPIPHTFRPTSFWWENFTETELIEYLKFVFESALNDYQLVVDKLFPKIGPHLSTYSMLPARLVCYLDFDTPSIWSTAPGISWYLEPLEYTKENTVEIRPKRDEVPPEPKEIHASVRQKIVSLRPDMADWLFSTYTSSDISYMLSNITTPISQIVYAWLSDDLHAVGWVGQRL